MPGKSINLIFAENLQAVMDRHQVNQPALARKSGISQKTISNCLNPGNRGKGTTGKEPSVNLINLQKIAEALDEDAWKLLRPLDQKQRQAYEIVESAFKVLLENGGQQIIQEDEHHYAADAIFRKDGNLQFVELKRSRNLTSPGFTATPKETLTDVEPRPSRQAKLPKAHAR